VNDPDPHIPAIGKYVYVGLTAFSLAIAICIAVTQGLWPAAEACAAPITGLWDRGSCQWPTAAHYGAKLLLLVAAFCALTVNIKIRKTHQKGA